MRTRQVVVVLAGIALAALVAVPAWAQEDKPPVDKKAELAKLQARLREIDGQLGSLRGRYSGDPEIVKLRLAEIEAGDKYDGAVAGRVKEDPSGAKFLAERDKAEAAYRKLEAQFRAIAAEVERSPQVARAKQAEKKASDEAQKARSKREAVVAAALKANPKAEELRKDMDAARREYEGLRRAVDDLTRALTQEPEVREAEKKFAEARAAREAKLKAALEGSADLQAAEKILQELGPKQAEAEAKVKAVTAKAESNDDALALKKAADEAAKTAEEKQAAYEKLRDEKLAKIDEYGALMKKREKADRDAQREIDKQLNEIRKKVDGEKDVAAPRQEAGKARREANSAKGKYDAKVRALIAADAESAEPTKLLKQLSDARRQASNLRRDIERGKEMAEADKAVKDAEAALRQARAEASKKTDEQVAKDPKGAGLLERRAEIVKKIEDLK